MNDLARIEQAMLRLSAAERERLALLAWESLEHQSFAADPTWDPEGIALARQRDEELRSGRSAAISHEEFLRRTGSGR